MNINDVIKSIITEGQFGDRDSDPSPYYPDAIDAVIKGDMMPEALDEIYESGRYLIRDVKLLQEGKIKALHPDSQKVLDQIEKLIARVEYEMDRLQEEFDSNVE